MSQVLGFQYSGIQVVLASGETSGVGNNGIRLTTAAFVNTSGYPFAEVEYMDGARASYAAGGAISVWFLRAAGVSGSYETGNSGILPSRAPDVVLPLASGTARVTNSCRIPYGFSQPLFRNDGTGVSLPGSGNIIRLNPFTFQTWSG